MKFDRIDFLFDRINRISLILFLAFQMKAKKPNSPLANKKNKFPNEKDLRN